MILDNPTKYKVDYNEALAMLGGRDRKVVGNNRVLVKSQAGTDNIILMLHNSPIITWRPDGSIRLDSLGYMTVTTKAAMNEFLPMPWGVVQVDRKWWVTKRGEKAYEFSDGVTIYPEGNVHNFGPRNDNPLKCSLCNTAGVHKDGMCAACYTRRDNPHNLGHEHEFKRGDRVESYRSIPGVGIVRSTNNRGQTLVKWSDHEEWESPGDIGILRGTHDHKRGWPRDGSYVSDNPVRYIRVVSSYGVGGARGHKGVVVNVRGNQMLVRMVTGPEKGVKFYLDPRDVEPWTDQQRETNCPRCGQLDCRGSCSEGGIARDNPRDTIRCIGDICVGDKVTVPDYPDYGVVTNVKIRDGLVGISFKSHGPVEWYRYTRVLKMHNDNPRITPSVPRREAFTMPGSYTDAKQYYHVRIRPPKRGEEFRTIEFKQDVKAVIGIHEKKGPRGGRSDVQKLLFDKNRFDVPAIKTWLKDNGFGKLK